jgi:hypothetical protein
MTKIETSEMNKRFEGFRDTPFLWIDLLDGLTMLSEDAQFIEDSPKFDSKSHIRLGKLIEQFVLFEFDKDASIEVLKSNIQVFQNQITIGEIDVLIKQLSVLIHLEIVYKFYLYDPSISGELMRWIGPNRNDSLVQKISKLKGKQLPLLYHSATEKLLNELNVKSEEFKQQLYFKAQLFVPYQELESAFPKVNNECVQGFYIRYKELSLFSNHTFYIPSKLDWLVVPHMDVEWIPEQAFNSSVLEFLLANKSPLCWLKSPKGKIQKFFVVWWE